MRELRPFEDGRLAEIERRLIAEFDAWVPPEVIRDCVAEAAGRLETAPVRSYVPILVARAARSWLRDAVLGERNRSRSSARDELGASNVDDRERIISELLVDPGDSAGLEGRNTAWSEPGGIRSPLL